MKISSRPSSTDSPRICQTGEVISLLSPFARYNTDDFSKCQKWAQKNRKPFLDFLSWCDVSMQQRLFSFISTILQACTLYSFDNSKICWYANSIALQVKFSHICGGLFSEKPAGRNSKHLSEPNALSKADAKS